MHARGAKRRGRLIAPHLVQRIGRRGHKLRLRALERVRIARHRVRRVQPGVVANGGVRADIRFEPGLRRFVRDVDDLDELGVHLIAGLQCVAPVDEEHRAVLQHHSEPRGARETREPGEPFRARRHIFALMLVRPRHEEARKPARLELFAQRRKPGRGRGGVGSVLEVLEHELNLRGRG